jgi:hypothetical protein
VMYVPPDFLTYLAVGQVRTTYVGVNPSDKKTGSGTCFLVKKADNLFVITNRHNLNFDYYKGNSTGYNLSSVFISFNSRNKNLSENEMSFRNNSVELPIEIFSLLPIEFSDNEYEDVVVFMNFFSKDLEVFAINFDELGTSADFCNTNPGEPIIVHAFSENASINYSLPVTRAGVISFVPQFDFCGRKEEPARRALVEFLSTQGMSGAPIFVSQRGVKAGPNIIVHGFRRGYLLGINCGHYHADEQRNGSIHAHLSNCIKATAISQLIEKCEKSYLSSRAACEDAL